MPKFLARLERAFLRVALNPAIRPTERTVALALARNVLVRVGAGSAVTALVVTLIEQAIH